jgi:integrase
MNGYAITRDKFFSVKEKKALIRVCKRKAVMDAKADRRTWITRYMLIHLALHSGLRVSEIAALKIEDLRFNGKENYLVVQCGKRGKKRDVYIDQELVKHLQNYVEMKRKWGEAVDSNSPLFTGRAGGHYTTTALEISFKKAIRKRSCRNGIPSTAPGIRMPPCSWPRPTTSGSSKSNWAMPASP